MNLFFLSASKRYYNLADLYRSQLDYIIEFNLQNYKILHVYCKVMPSVIIAKAVLEK